MYVLRIKFSPLMTENKTIHLFFYSYNTSALYYYYVSLSNFKPFRNLRHCSCHPAVTGTGPSAQVQGLFLPPAAAATAAGWLRQSMAFAANSKRPCLCGIPVIA